MKPESVLFILLISTAAFAKDRIKNPDQKSFDSFDEELLTASDAQIDQLKNAKAAVAKENRSDRMRSAKDLPTSEKHLITMPISPGGGGSGSAGSAGVTSTPSGN